MKKLFFVVSLISFCLCVSACAPVKQAKPLKQTKPLKVYILSGQSNMQGQGLYTTYSHIAMDPATKPMYDKMFKEDGTARVFDNVYISTLGCAKGETNKYLGEKSGKLTTGYGSYRRGEKIGPELTFGIYMQEHLNEPILLIKPCWGGKSLYLDYRPPSAGLYEFAPGVEPNDKMLEQRRKASGVFYRMMIDHVKKVLADIKSVYPDYDPKLGYKVEGFVWFQGCNDFGDNQTYPNKGQAGCYDEYSRLLACLIRDVRKEVNAPDMKAVIGVIGLNGELETERPRKIVPEYISWLKIFRKAMAAPASMPEFKGDVSAVYTEKYWDSKLEELICRGDKIKAKENELKKQQVAHLEKKPRLRRMRLNAENQAKLDAYRKTIFTEEETELLMNATSNAVYHYMGSAKIYGRIGKGFAEAMIKVSK